MVFVDVWGWSVTREYVDVDDGILLGPVAKRMLVDAGANWFDAVLVLSLGRYGGKWFPVRILVERLAEHRCSFPDSIQSACSVPRLEFLNTNSPAPARLVMRSLSAGASSSCLSSSQFCN